MAQRIPLDALQKAVSLKLRGDIAVTDLVGRAKNPRIFDHVLQGAEHPFIVIGEYEDEGVRTKQRTASQPSFEVEVFTKSKGLRQMNDIMDVVLESLTESTLDLTADGFRSIRTGMLIRASAVNEQDPSDGLIVQHGTLEVGFTIDTVP